MSNIATDTAVFLRTNYWPSRYVDACIIKRETGASFDDNTGVSIPTYTVNYSGPCLIRPLMGPRSVSDEIFGQELLQVRGYAVMAPYTEIDQLPGDLVDVTASLLDAFLVGKQLVVVNPPGDSYITNRAIICTLVVGEASGIVGTGGASQGDQGGAGSG